MILDNMVTGQHNLHALITLNYEDVGHNAPYCKIRGENNAYKTALWQTI